MTKSVHFRISDSLWEKFYMMFPGHGERSAFFRSVIRRAIEVHEIKQDLLDKVVDKTLERIGYEDD